MPHPTDNRSPEFYQSSVEALDQMTQLFVNAANTLKSEGVVRDTVDRVWHLNWPTHVYLSDHEYPGYPGTTGSPRYEADRKYRKDNGALDTASMSFNREDMRLKSAKFRYVLPDTTNSRGFDAQVWQVQAPAEIHANGKPRMIIDTYELPGSLLGIKLSEIEERFTEVKSSGLRVITDSDAYNAAIVGEYNDIWKNLYKNTNSLGVPLLTRDHRRIVLGQEVDITADQHQDLTNLAGTLVMAVDAGVRWAKAFRADPLEQVA